MDVRRAEMDDVGRIVDLWVDLAADQRRHGSHVLAEDNRTRIRESVVRHVVAETLLVARCDDESSGSEGVVGFVMFTVEAATYDQDVRRGVVENLYVAPPHRDDGVGSRLLGAAEATLTDRGVDVFSLEAMAANERAHEFYRDHGYDRHRIAFEKRAESDTHSKGDE